MELPESIYQYITQEETRFDTDEVQIGHNWRWNFKNHIQMIFHLKNGVFFTGENNWLRSFKNIMEPLLNLSYWAEDIEVKDVIFFIESEIGHIQSFLIKKYHDEIYVKENNLDTLFDEITEDDLDYGGVLVQKTNQGRPEIIYLNSIVFCDQTDILGGPIAFKYNFSPSKLRNMADVGWGEERNGATISLEELITLATAEKEPAGVVQGKKNLVTGKNIEVYVLHGALPDHYLKDNNDMEYYCEQVQVVAFYRDKKNKKQGVTLYRKKEEEGNLKFHTSKKIYGRALGKGVGEGLLHPQIWTNFLEIHKMNLLEAASKVPLITDDTAYANRNKIQEMENLEITTIEEGKSIRQIPTAAPANIQLYERSVNEWYEQAQLIGSAFDPLLGKEAVSGTTFRGQNQIITQGRGLHNRRRGQRAKFFEEIYRDWIIPDMVKEIINGKKFLATLSAEEMSWVSEQLADNAWSTYVTEKILNGELVYPEDETVMKQTFMQDFSKKGNKHVLEILKGEFEDVEIKMGINIAAKQKDLAGLTDKLFSILQFVFANPQGFQQVMQIPSMQRAFDDILEFSGISPIEFSAMASKNFQPQQLQQPQQQSPQIQTSQLANAIA